MINEVVKIKNNLYTVVLVNKDSEKLRSEDPNVEILGRTYVLSNAIYIRNDLESNRLFTVLVHELTHAYIDSYGFTGRSYNEEDLCTFNEVYAADIVSTANSVFKSIMTGGRSDEGNTNSD